MTTTDVMGRIDIGGKLIFLFGNGFTDGTETELKVLDLGGNSVSIGDHLQGQTIRSIGIQCSDGSVCTTLILYGKDSGIKAYWRGRERLVGNNMFYNLESKDLNLHIERGDVLKINTAD